MEPNQLVKEIYIEQAIQRYLATGGKLVQRTFGLITERFKNEIGQYGYRWSVNPEKNVCCGLGCVLLLEESTSCEDPITALDKLFDSRHWVYSFVRGFDGGDEPFNNKNQDGFDFGRKMWEKYGSR